MKKPTISEIADFCKERGNHVDPEQFYYYYESVGWKVGGKKPMISWKACVHTWERNTTHPMAIKGRDEAVRAEKQILRSKPLPKPKANPKILELNKEMFALTGGLRGATSGQRILINTRIRVIRKEIETLKDNDMKLTLDISR